MGRMHIWRLLLLVLALFLEAPLLCSAAEDDYDDEDDDEDEDDEEIEAPDNTDSETQDPDLAWSHDAIKSLFKKLDSDGNGKTSVDEFLTHLTATQRRDAMEQDHSALQQMDTDKDGKVSSAEFFKFAMGDQESEEHTKEMAAYKTHETEKFNHADLDKDGALSLEELITLSNVQLNDKVSETSTAKYLREKDEDGDGKLTVVEIFEVEREDTIRDFKKLDKDGDGKLDLKELMPLESGQFYFVDTIEGMFDIADKDGDGHLTVDEVLAAETTLQKEAKDTPRIHSFHLLHEWTKNEL